MAQTYDRMHAVAGRGGSAAGRGRDEAGRGPGGARAAAQGLTRQAVVVAVAVVDAVSLCLVTE